MAVPADGVRLRVPVAGAAVEHLNLGEVERRVADRHRLAGQLRRGLIHVALELIVAVRAATVRMASHKNAASSCAAGTNRSVPALHRCSGVAPVEEWSRTWYWCSTRGGEPAVELLQALGTRRPGAGLPSGEISTRNWPRTVSKNRSILPRPSGRYGGEWVIRMRSFAQVTAIVSSTKHAPLFNVKPNSA